MPRLPNLLPSLLGLTLLAGTAVSYGGGGLSLPVSMAHRSPTSVVGLGDSVPAGTACGCDDYVHLVAAHQQLASGRRVLTHNLAQDGQTSVALLAQLRTGWAARDVAAADVTVITIGANDFDSSVAADASCSPADGLACYQRPLAGLRANLVRLVDRIHQLQGRSARHRVLLTGYWNVFLDGSVGRAHGPAYVAAADALTRAVNQTIAGVAARTGAAYVDLYWAFKGGGQDSDDPLLASDGDHPSAAGHQVIAAAVLAKLGSA